MQGFISKLKDHLLRRICGLHYDGDADQLFSDDERNSIRIRNDTICRIADDERSDDAENTDNDKEDEEAKEVFDDEDEFTRSERDVETDDDDIGYDAL